jgi:hypothetical protein
MDMKMLSTRARCAIQNSGGGAQIADEMEDGFHPYAWILRIPNCGRKTSLEVVAYLIAAHLTPPARWSTMSAAKIREINGHLSEFGWAGPMIERDPPLIRVPKFDNPATYKAEIAKLEDRLLRLADKKRETEGALRSARRRLAALESKS